MLDSPGMALTYPLRQLARLCAQHPLTPKILLVPGVRAGYDLTTALTRSGHPWTNLRVTTPVLLAAEETGPLRGARGARRLTATMGCRLLEAILADWPAAERRYFPPPPAAGEGALARSLFRTFDDLRLHDVLPEHLGDLERVDKAADLRRLYARYCTRLADEAWWDTAELVETARRAAQEHAPFGAIWAVLDETPLPGKVLDYVAQRAGGPPARIGRLDYGVPLPPDCAGARWPGLLPEEPLPERAPTVRSPRRPTAAATSSSLVQGDLFLDGVRDADEPVALYAAAPSTQRRADVDVAPGGRLLTGGLTSADGDRLRLWQTVGLETEVRSVVRDILSEGIRLDEVELVYTASAPYRDLLQDAVARWDLPADFAAGRSATLTPPGRHVARFLDWIAEGVQGDHLAACLRGGDLGWEGLPSPSRVARWLMQGRAQAGRAGTLAALDRLEPPPRRDGEGGPAVERETRLREELSAAAVHLGALFDCVPDSDHAGELAQGAVRFLQGLPCDGGDEESLARRQQREALLAHLQEATDWPDLPGRRADHARRLRAHLDDLSLDTGRAQPGGLRIAPLHEAGYSGRGHIYVIGLDESHFPGTPAQDAVLLDDERQRLSEHLVAARAAPSSAVFHLLRLLGSAAGRVTLICSRLHLADGREPWPSPLFEQARRQLGLPAHAEHRSPAGSGGVADDTAGRATVACDDLEALLARRRSPGLRPGLALAYPDVAHGSMARRARAAPSRFAGWIGGDGDERLDVAGERTLSSRMLETLAACPRRYLMQYGLGLRPPDEPVVDPRRWLTPLEMGNLLHGLFLDFMQSLGPDERPGPQHAEPLAALMEAAIEAQRQQIPVTLEAAYRADRRRIKRAARIFLHAEAQRLAAEPALTPLAFERDFGFDEGGPAQVALSHEVTFRLRGRVDRIDAVRDAEGAIVAYEVWDYKTGSTYNYEHEDLLKGGRILQWALYAHALPQILPEAAPVRLSGYFFAGDRGLGQRFHDAPPARHELADKLQPLFDLARRGYFPALHKGDARGGGACRFCDFRRVCADEARGDADVEGLVDTAAQLAGLVEGWAETTAAGRAGSRRSIEATLAELGLAPGDAAPDEAVRPARDWVRA